MRARVTGCRLPDLGTHSWYTPAVYINACLVSGVVYASGQRRRRREANAYKKKNKKIKKRKTHTHTTIIY